MLCKCLRAGFAVGRRNSPLDLGLASVLRKRFGVGGLPGEQGEVALVAEWTELALQQVLTGIAALYDPTTTPSDSPFLVATFVGFDKKGQPRPAPRDPDPRFDNLSAIAADAGYESAAAFTKAFKRSLGKRQANTVVHC